MKASIWAAKKALSDSSPTCVPTRRRYRTTLWPRCARHRQGVWQGVSARVAEHLQVEEGRAGSARSHSSDRRCVRHPDQIKQFLQEDEYKVYKLIWQRFVASQMNPAVFDQTTVEIDAKKRATTIYRFRVTGSVLKFEGFLKVYEESKDSKDEEDEALKHKLPVLTEGQKLTLKGIDPEQHFTEPPRASTKRRW